MATASLAVLLLVWGCSSVIYTGRVVVAGSEPQVQVVLVATDARYEMVGELLDELRGLQGATVSVSGTLILEARGPGFPAQLEVERILQR